jgi:UPF0042 nucleotide-binding protein
MTVPPVTSIPASQPVSPVQLAIITGLSGAGRSTAAKCLEDLGWFVVDNLPPALLPTMAELGVRSHGTVDRIAAVVDVRGRAFFADLREALRTLDERGTRPRVLFLEASDRALVSRFESVRRPHPLRAREPLVDGIAAERALLAELRGEADLVLDTTDLNVHQLRAKIDAAFGFKHGLPLDADIVLDCRFLPNPHWVEELRPQSGLDPGVREYVFSRPGAAEFLERSDELLAIVRAGYAEEGKRFLTLAIGCTGGRHRSVAMSTALAERLLAGGVDVRVVHRDLGRE